MRTILASLVVLTACGAEVQEPDATSVRELLSREPQMLEVSLPDSAGAITASRKTDGEWVPGLADLKIEHGSILLSADSEAITLDDLVIDVGTIAIPDTVFGYPLEFSEIRLSLVEPVKVVGWTNDNEAHGNTELQLLLEWSLVNHGTTTPLGSPDLPPVPVELAVSGTGDHVHAEARISAPGELWGWANVFRLEDLSLVIAGDTN